MQLHVAKDSKVCPWGRSVDSECLIITVRCTMHIPKNLVKIPNFFPDRDYQSSRLSKIFLLGS